MVSFWWLKRLQEVRHVTWCLKIVCFYWGRQVKGDMKASRADKNTQLPLLFLWTLHSKLWQQFSRVNSEDPHANLVWL